MYKPSAVEIQARLDRKLCIWCGVNHIIDWPYVCNTCQHQLAQDELARRQNSHPEASLFPLKE